MKINFFVYVIAGIVVLFGLVLVFKPKTTGDVSQKTNSSSSAATLAPTNTKTFELQVVGRKLVGSSETLQAKEGDEVTIKITADEDEELHLHGYDNSVEIEKDKTAELKFTANLTGRFSFELEKSKTDIGILEVLPK